MNQLPSKYQLEYIINTFKLHFIQQTDDFISSDISSDDERIIKQFSDLTSDDEQILENMLHKINEIDVDFDYESVTSLFLFSILLINNGYENCRITIGILNKIKELISSNKKIEERSSKYTNSIYNSKDDTDIIKQFYHLFNSIDNPAKKQDIFILISIGFSRLNIKLLFLLFENDIDNHKFQNNCSKIILQLFNNCYEYDFEHFQNIIILFR